MGAVTEQVSFAVNTCQQTLYKNHSATFAPEVPNLLSARLKLGFLQVNWSEKFECVGQAYKKAQGGVWLFFWNAEHM